MCRLLHIYFTLCCLLISEKNFVRCVCKGTIAVFCESITDLKTASQMSVWKEIIIGNECQKPQHTLDKNTLVRINAKEIRIINQFNASHNIIDVPVTTSTVVLYGNNLTTVFIFYLHVTNSLHKLDLLSLHHNDIKSINLNYCFGSFASDLNIFVNQIDLSHNKLEDVKSVNKSCVNLSADELILSHNKLWLIRPNGLPTGLRRLHLDHNKFVYFSTMNLNTQNLSQLEFLTVAHNKLQVVDDLPAADSLTGLDLSFNNLYYIPEELFGRFKNLEMLNLERNSLIRFTFPVRKFTQYSFKTIDINLAFNRLRKLDLTPIKNYKVKLRMFGNPWNCKCIYNLQYELIESRKTLLMEMNCFPDHVPLCVINQFYGEPCSDEQIEESTFNFFRNITDRIMDWPRDHCSWITI